MEQTFVDNLIQAASSAQWGVLAGAILMVLVWLFRRVTNNRIPANYQALITSGVAMVVIIAGGLLAGAPWYHALLSGLLVGGAASGFWSLLGKYILPKPKP